MKRKIAVLLAAAMTLALVACGGNTSGGEASPAAPAESSAEAQTPASEAAPASEASPAAQPEGQDPEALLGSEPVEITFWHCASDDAGVLMDKYIEDFNANNEYGITVNAVYQGQYSDATTLLRSVLSAQNYNELPDVMQMDATGKTIYFTSGKAFTVDDAVAEYNAASDLDQYLPAALATWHFSNTQLGIPFSASTTVTFYNMDLLAEAGWTDRVPETFADVIQLHEDLVAAGQESAVAFQSIPNTPTLANWIGQLGGYVVNERNGSEGTASELACIDDGTLETFLTEWKAMYDAGALINADASKDDFIAGKVAVMTNSSSNVNSILAAVDGAFEVGVGGYLRVNDAAASGATVNGAALVMFDSEDALRKAASYEFVKYLTSAGVQADFAAGTGYIPVNTASTSDPAYQAVVEAYPQYEATFKQLEVTPTEMCSVTVGPSKDFYYAIAQDISDMLSYNQTVEETVEIMEDDLNGLLEEYLRSNPD